jgi:enolase
MKNTPINELKSKISILIDLEIEQAMKNKEYERIKISDLPQIQAYSYILQLIEKLNLAQLEKQIIIDAWEDMSEAKTGIEYYGNNFNGF